MSKPFLFAVVSHGMHHVFSGVGCLVGARRNMEVNGSAVKAAHARTQTPHSERSVGRDVGKWQEVT